MRSVPGARGRRRRAWTESPRQPHCLPSPSPAPAGRSLRVHRGRSALSHYHSYMLRNFLTLCGRLCSRSSNDTAVNRRAVTTHTLTLSHSHVLGGGFFKLVATCNTPHRLRHQSRCLCCERYIHNHAQYLTHWYCSSWAPTMPGGRRVLEAVVGLQLEAGVEQAQIHLSGHADEPDCSPALLRQWNKSVECVSVRGM